MLSRTDFIQVIADKEELLRELGYPEYAIVQLEVDALDLAKRSKYCSTEDYINALDKLIANKIGAVVAELN